MDSKNSYAFSNGKPKTIKTIRVSATLGMNEDPKEIFDAVRGDLMRFHVSMTYKPYQALDTVNRLLFLGAPQDANKHEAEETIYRILSELEVRRRTYDPDGFPPEIHGGVLPWFAIVSEQPGGLPYVEKSESEKATSRVGPPASNAHFRYYARQQIMTVWPDWLWQPRKTNTGRENLDHPATLRKFQPMPTPKLNASATYR